MNKDTLHFLKKLQQELKTQDTDCQANPRFWVVAQYEWQITHPDCAEKWFYVDEEGTSIENANKVIEFLDDCGCFEDNDDKEKLTNMIDGGMWHSEFDDYVEENYNINYIPMQKVHVIKPNTMFITKQGCRDHIERNHYHYNETVYTYAMTAWRAPKVKKLFDILYNEDWGDNE